MTSATITPTELQTIKCYPDTKIYVLCPANHATGGPEALHQLAYHLIKMGFNAFMYYLPDDAAEPVHPFYSHYNVPFVRRLENTGSNILIMPESYLLPLYQYTFTRMRKVIWWLSVNNYHEGLKTWSNFKLKRKKWSIASYLRSRRPPVPVFKELAAKNVIHIRHSYYSEAHLKENGLRPIGKISDYMNASFFSMIDTSVVKEDIVIYNPKKNDDFLQSIIDQTPRLNWKPLIDLPPADVAMWMNRSKVYIDFGSHPGKERMPREACLSNCCLIIGKIGSAQYHQDMPIADKYRFEKDTTLIPEIIARIEDCLVNYNTCINDFKQYRTELINEENTFIEDIQNIFKLVK